jgi:hypothetical protein
VCESRGRVSATVEVDHIRALHDGGTNARENLQGLCAECHKAKSRAELGGTVVGLNGEPSGWSTGQWTPGRRGRVAFDLMYPTVEPPALPVTLVCGPPCGGKSTYVQAHKAHGDEVIDVDDILRGMGIAPRSASIEDRTKGLTERNRRIRALAWYRGDAARAWFITAAPRADMRERWSRLLRVERVLLCMPDEDECARRIRLEHERRKAYRIQRGLIRRWFSEYEARQGDEVVAQ